MLSNSINWNYEFVYGVVRSKDEIELIKNSGINIIQIKDVLKDLVHPSAKVPFTTYAATDILEIMSLMKESGMTV